MELLTRDTLPGLIGATLGPGEWLEVSQERIDEFARASGDDQWIHVDVERAKNGPFGATIAHGLLSLSMISMLSKSLLKFDGFKMSLNYGYEKVRFPSPVPVGSQLRVTARILSFEPVGQYLQTVVEYSVERQGSEKPTCVAQMIFRHVP